MMLIYCVFTFIGLFGLMLVLVIAATFEEAAQEYGRTNIDNNIDSPFYWSFLPGLLGFLLGAFVPYLINWLRIQTDPSLTYYGDNGMSSLAGLGDAFLLFIQIVVIGLLGASLGSVLGGIYGLKRFRRSRRR